MIVYTIQSGDTLWKIAQSNNIALDALVAANPQITDPNQIFVGQVINIPQLWQPAAPGTRPYPLPTPEVTPNQPASPGTGPLPLPTPEVTPEVPCTDQMGQRPCIYLAHEGETLESIGHTFMIPLSRLLYYNLRYSKREPLGEGARIIIPEAEIQPVGPVCPRSNRSEVRRRK